MKIKINYDVIDKIFSTNKGYSIQKIHKESLQYFSFIVLPLSTTVEWGNLTDGNPLPFLIKNITSISVYSIGNFIGQLSIKDVIRCKSLIELNKLLYDLNKIYIDTDLDLLLKSYEYKTDYKIKLDESKIPYILQEKYIMMPTYDNKEVKETSILQKHIIGSQEYELSRGTPKKSKVLKLSYNNI